MDMVKWRVEEKIFLVLSDRFMEVVFFWMLLEKKKLKFIKGLIFYRNNIFEI